MYKQKIVLCKEGNLFSSGRTTKFTGTSLPSMSFGQLVEEYSLEREQDKCLNFSFCRWKNRSYMSSRTVMLICVMQEKSHLKIASNVISIEMLERFVKGNTHVKYIFGPKPPIIGYQENMLISPLPVLYLIQSQTINPLETQARNSVV